MSTKKKKYITSCQHESDADALEIRDGKPYDSGNDDGKQGGFDCFDFEMYGEKVQSFVHC